MVTKRTRSKLLKLNYTLLSQSKPFPAPTHPLPLNQLFTLTCTQGVAVVLWITRWATNPRVIRWIPCFFTLLDETFKRDSAFVWPTCHWNVKLRVHTITITVIPKYFPHPRTTPLYQSKTKLWLQKRMPTPPELLHPCILWNKRIGWSLTRAFPSCVENLVSKK